MVTNEPVIANLRVGLLLEVLDKLAENTALKYVRRTYPHAVVVTAAIDDLKVCSAPSLEKDIILLARINFVGTTSVEVGIRLEQEGDPGCHLGSCYFTMVARQSSEEGQITLPPLRLESATDRRRADRAEGRRLQRKESKIFAAPSQQEWEHMASIHALRAHVPHRALFAGPLTVSTWERTYPEQENVPQSIFGGYIIHRAYVCAHLCAEMVADHRALLVAAHRINFYEPVRMGDKLHFLSRVRYTGSTSVVVETEIIRFSRDRKLSALSNTCAFTFVNVDHELRPRHVLPVIPESFIEDDHYLAEYRRHRIYLASRAALSLAARVTA
jgi:acyl-coenzyme A thioesterase 9